METTDTGRLVERFALEVFTRERVLDPGTRSEFFLRFVLLLKTLQHFFLTESAAERDMVTEAVRLLREQYRYLGIRRLTIQKYLDGVLQYLETAPNPSSGGRNSWASEPVSRRAAAIPGMMYEDTMRYYRWLGRQYTGVGEVVELGAWMGCSTMCLLDGLTRNPSFHRHRLHVMDAFEWETWMVRYCEPALARRYAPGDSFLETFLGHIGSLAARLAVHQCALYPRNKRGSMPPMRWAGMPVELLVVDFSDERWVIDRIWETFIPTFIPGRTVIVLNQFGDARAEGLRDFVLDHSKEVAPLHKPYASTKSFLFTGAGGSRPSRAPRRS